MNDIFRFVIRLVDFRRGIVVRDEGNEDRLRDRVAECLAACESFLRCLWKRDQGCRLFRWKTKERHDI